MNTAAKKPKAILDDTPLDDTALKRLEALTKRKKTDPKLTADEIVELRELQVRKGAAELAKQNALLIETRRWRDDQAKYRLGTLVIEAGLDKWPDDLLTAGLRHLADFSESEKAALLASQAKVDSAAPSPLTPDDVPLPTEPMTHAA